MMFRRPWQSLPPLLRFMITHFSNGVVLGWSAGLVLIWLDVAGIGALMAAHDSAWVTTLYFAQAGLLFGTSAMSVAVMNLADDEA